MVILGIGYQSPSGTSAIALSLASILLLYALSRWIRLTIERRREQRLAASLDKQMRQTFAFFDGCECGATGRLRYRTTPTCIDPSLAPLFYLGAFLGFYAGDRSPYRGE